MTDEQKAKAIELLEATHVFPGGYAVSVIGTAYDEVTASIRAAVDAELSAPLPESEYVTVVSGGGKYRSHRVTVPVPDAEAVLRLIQRLRAVAGVVTVL